MVDKAIIQWIAEDDSDFAQHIREMFRPMIDQFYTLAVDFGRLNHRHIMRRKIRRYARRFV